MKETAVTCDACGGQLSDAGAMPTYALVLSSFAVPNSGNIVFSVAVQPHISRDRHFCDLGCLDDWRDDENLRADVLRNLREAWKIAHGTPDENGRIWSYPCPPNEISEGWEAEANAAVASVAADRKAKVKR